MQDEILNDPVIKFVIHCVKPRNWIRKFWLFGSRASIQHTEKSDYDLAFELDENMPADWGSFCLELRENNPSLNQLDLIRMDQIEREFAERILKNGKKIYERL